MIKIIDYTRRKVVIVKKEIMETRKILGRKSLRSSSNFSLTEVIC